MCQGAANAVCVRAETKTDFKRILRMPWLEGYNQENETVCAFFDAVGWSHDSHD